MGILEHAVLKTNCYLKIGVQQNSETSWACNQNKITGLQKMDNGRHNICMKLAYNIS
jgi:hypothetical protein